jgi:3-hydroxyisobutyrate dehydrogenase-like beta-hydroxyacid dehydrogenase
MDARPPFGGVLGVWYNEPREGWLAASSQSMSFRGNIVNKQKLGILHPGNMGISIAASALNSNCEVYWASEGRSAQTHERAEEFNLHDTKTLAALCDTCSAIVSVCPPHAAEEVAEEVLACGFTGLYLDANAISPPRAVRIGEKMIAAGVTFVDGGIIGGPAWEPGRTWLYLSGGQAREILPCFSAGPLETEVIGEAVGKASALKMCYAAWTKGSTALLCAILAAADSLEVWEELRQQWERDWPGFADQSANRVRQVTAKAWRFAGEMNEISATFEGAGVPGGFHAAAADLYRRIAHFKNDLSTPMLEEVLAALIEIAGARE